MENKLLGSKLFLYVTEFFAGVSVMAVELGASRLMPRISVPPRSCGRSSSALS